MVDQAIPSSWSYHLNYHGDGIRTALEEWHQDLGAAKMKYGPIEWWDTSAVTSLDELFISTGRWAYLRFDADISRWDVSNVKSMHATCKGATMFNCDISCWDVSEVRTDRN